MKTKSIVLSILVFAAVTGYGLVYAAGNPAAADEEFNRPWPKTIDLMSSLVPEHDPKLLPKSGWTTSFVESEGKCKTLTDIEIRVVNKHDPESEEPWVVAKNGKNYGGYIYGVPFKSGEFDCVSHIKSYEQGGVVAFMPGINTEGPWRYTQAHFQDHLVAVVPVMRRQQVQIELRIDMLKQTLVCFPKNIVDWSSGGIALEDVGFELYDKDRDGKPDITLLLNGIGLEKQMIYLSSYATKKELVGYVVSGGVPTKAMLLRDGVSDPFVKCKE